MLGSSLSLALRAMRSGPACGCPGSLRRTCRTQVVSSTHPYQQPQKKPLSGLFLSLAERVGFEPTVRLHARLISSQVHSTTLPPLRKWAANDTGSKAG